MIKTNSELHKYYQLKRNRPKIGRLILLKIGDGAGDLLNLILEINYITIKKFVKKEDKNKNG